MKIQEIFCSVFVPLPLISFAIFRPVLNKKKHKPYKSLSQANLKDLSS